MNEHTIWSQLRLIQQHSEGRLEDVKFMIESGMVDLDVQDADGFSALMVAAVQHSAGHVDVVKYLLDAGASTRLRTSDAKGTALHLAAKNGCLECVKAIIEKDRDILNWKTCEGDTPLMWAALAGNVLTTMTLLSYDADVFETNNNHYNALICAAMSNQEETGRDILDLSGTGGDEGEYTIRTHDDTEASIIMHSIITYVNDKMGKEKMEQLINHQDNVGSTALHVATLCLNVHCISELLLNGIDVTLKDDRGLTALEALTILMDSIDRRHDCRDKLALCLQVLNSHWNGKHDIVVFVLLCLSPPSMLLNPLMD